MTTTIRTLVFMFNIRKFIFQVLYNLLNWHSILLYVTSTTTSTQNFKRILDCKCQLSTLDVNCGMFCVVCEWWLLEIYNIVVMWWVIWVNQIIMLLLRARHIFGNRKFDCSVWLWSVNQAVIWPPSPKLADDFCGSAL